MKSCWTSENLATYVVEITFLNISKIQIRYQNILNLNLT